jgi:hypothetical protein
VLHQSEEPDSRFQVLRYRRKLLQRCLQFFSDLQRQDVRVRKIGAVLERFIPLPKYVEVDLVSLEQVFIGEGFKPLAFLRFRSKIEGE